MRNKSNWSYRFAVKVKCFSVFLVVFFFNKLCNTVCFSDVTVHRENENEVNLSDYIWDFFSAQTFDYYYLLTPITMYIYIHPLSMITSNSQRTTSQTTRSELSIRKMDTTGLKTVTESGFVKWLKKFSYSFQIMVYSQYASYGAGRQTGYEIVLYFVIGFFGVLGNVVTCIVIANTKTMRTITNTYLFNLAISDLLILVFGFPPWNGYVDYRYDVFCKLRYFLL